MPATMLKAVYVHVIYSLLKKYILILQLARLLS